MSPVIESARDWFTRRGRTLGAGALVLAALAVGRVVSDGLPDARAVATRPIERGVAVGETAHLRVGELTVTEVTGGKAWVDVSSGKLTPGLWLVADVDLLPSRRDSGLSYAAVRDDAGHVWELGRGTSTCKAPVAGVPMRCKVVVEIPARAIPGAELVLRWNGTDDRWDDQAVVPVTLDAATVGAWSAVTEPIEVPLATVGRP